MAPPTSRKSRTSPEESRRLLIDATMVVLSREGFGGTSARTVAAEAGSTNGLIFYHFGSMDGLLAATASELSDRRMSRVREALGGDNAATLWPYRLADAIRDEAAGDEGRAVVELLVGSRTSPGLAKPIADAIDRSIAFASNELQTILGDNPIVQLVPADLLAELATAAFFGLELFTQGGREVDIERLARTAALGFAQLASLGTLPQVGPE
ncbi:MAG: TetR/AcrR family transcriptional regulator [Acidimicrobiales bacterium]